LPRQQKITLPALIRYFALFIIPPVLRFERVQNNFSAFENRLFFSIEQAANMIRMAVR